MAVDDVTADPSQYWRRIFKESLQSLISGGWFQNTFCGVCVTLILAFVITYLMNSKQAGLIGCAVGITGLFWLLVLIAYVEIGKEAPGRGTLGDGPAKGETASPSTSPQPLTPEEPMNDKTAKTGDVNAPNNQGNINTGPVNGPLTQTVNQFGPKQRTLSDAQKADLKAAFLQFAGTQNLRVSAWIWDNEACSFGQEISDCRPADNDGLTRSQYQISFPGFVGITVKNPDKPPTSLNSVAKAFQDAGIPIKGMYDVTLPDENTIEIRIYPNCK